LTTAKLFCSDSYQDVLEPMKYYHEKYGKNKKSMAIGCSMGAIILANLMGHEGENSFIDAACIMQAPIKQWESAEQLKTACFGAYDRTLGHYLKEVWL
jgi:predicted alpha/beta-fold hydrolase